MPQDIPLEASETLAFIPPSLREMPGAPTFTLRACTWREKRAARKLTESEGIEFHSTGALRAEARAGLKKLWAERADEFLPRVEAWWDANDAFDKEREGNPEALFEFDDDEAEAIRTLLDRLEKMHRPLATMIADNSDYIEMRYPVLVAIAVTSWTGLSTVREIEGGYLSLGCVMALLEELHALARANGVTIGQVPFLELGSACHDRMYLSEAEAKNSAAPSPSETPPEVSTTTGADPGPSPESTARTASLKSSPKTRAKA